MKLEILVMQVNDARNFVNAINTYLINLNIIFFFFSLNTYGYPKYHRHKYYHKQMENHRHIRIVHSFSCYQLKIFLK